jgi:hypothetical protein
VGRELMAFFLEFIKSGLEDFAVRDCVVIVKVVVGRGLFVNGLQRPKHVIVSIIKRIIHISVVF